jgi:hypothetical protein
MSLVTLLAGKGSPGVTTSALVLAAVWPGTCALLEADPAGGDLLYRLRAPGDRALVAERGVVSLATAARNGADPSLVFEHSQLADGGLPVLIGPGSSRQAQRLDPWWPALAKLMAGAEQGDVIADAGRLSAQTPAALLRESSLVVLVCRASVESVAHTRAAVEVLKREHQAVPVVLPVGDAGSSRQVGEALRACGELEVLPALAFDPPAAAALAGEWNRRLDRSSLVGSARAAAGRLHRQAAADRAKASTPSHLAHRHPADVGVVAAGATR